MAPPSGCAPVPRRAGRATAFDSENFLLTVVPRAKSRARPHRAWFEITHRRRDARFWRASHRVEQMSKRL